MNGNDDDIEDDDVHWNAVINDVPGFTLKLKHILQCVKSRVNMVKEGILNEAKREALVAAAALVDLRNIPWSYISDVSVSIWKETEKFLQHYLRFC